jgi:glutamate dehydrogenase/leucine dehydrogenase
MTYKCALAGLPFGGGKGVIIAGPKTKKAAIIRAYAEKVNLLRGAFYTGEDVGMAKRDVEVMGRVSKYVIGRSSRDGRPAYWTALGVFSTMERLGKHVWGAPGVAGRTIAIRGLGKVGLALAEFVAKGGGQVIGADIDPGRVRTARARISGIRFVSPREIGRVRADIFAPCALGGEFTERSVRELKCKMVCGGANNQLATRVDGMRLFRRNILYVPDYLVNAGGLIDVTAELRPHGMSAARIEQKVREIPKTAERIIRLAERRSEPANVTADRLAETRFKRR